jgi:hypothetical protein
MRGLWSTLASLVVLVGLGAYIYFGDPGENANSAPASEEVFASLDTDDIDQLIVRGESGEVTTLTKEGGVWRITDPIKATASDVEASGVARSLADLEVVRVIDEKGANPGEYGLEKPRLEIQYRTANDEADGKLLVGDVTPTGAQMYARRNDEPRIFLVPQSQNLALNKSTFDLREKALFTIDRTKVDRVEVSLPGRAIEFAKDGDAWMISKPLSTPADSAAVEVLVGRVQTAQMTSIVTESATPAELRKYGLVNPEAAATVRMGGESVTLAIGGKAGDNALYARNVATPIVVTVEPSLADELRKQIDEYRRKDAFEFRAFNASRLEVTRGGQTITFEKVPGTGENAVDSWRRVNPNPAAVDTTKAEALLSALSEIQAASFVPANAKTGLQAPAATVAVTFGDTKKVERVSFGQTGSDVYFGRPDQPDAGKIDRAKYDEALKTLDELSK